MLMGGVAQGAVPVSFAISGTQFKISSTELDGTGFSQYSGVAKDAEGAEHAVVTANIKNASLENLCQSAVQETPWARSESSSRLAARANQPRRRTCRSA